MLTFDQGEIRSSGWGGLPTAVKMLVILSLGLLPLGVAAILASVGSAREIRSQGIVQARALLAVHSQRLSLALSRTAYTIRAARDAIAEWARVSYGWIGRSPDYKAAFLATLGANASYYAPYDENARRWYKKVNDEVSFVNHAIVNPPVDRDKPLDEVKDVYMHVEEETDAGLVVSGAKWSRRHRRSRTSTSSPITAPCPSRPSRSPSSAWCRQAHPA